MDTISYTVTGDPAQVRTDLQSAIEAAGLACTWTDEWTGYGKKGNPVANFFGGWLSQYIKVDFRVRTETNGDVTVALSSSTGAMGGIPGQRKVQKTFGLIIEDLEKAFADRGVLRPGTA